MSKVAIVTGGGSGIGRALGTALAGRGVHVVAADIDAGAASEAAADITANGGGATSATVDVTSKEQADRVVRDTASARGRLDYMFNNAGMGIEGDFSDLSDAHWEKVVAVNWWGTLYGSQAAYTVMTRQGFGHIVNTASMAGLLADPVSIPYSASKHAVVALSLGVRWAGADCGIYASVVCPGLVCTDILDTTKIVNISDEKAREFNRSIGSKGIEPADAAQRIMRGVEANRAIIAFPARERWLWRLYPLSPALFERVLKTPLTERIRTIRRLRDESRDGSVRSEAMGS